MPPQTFPKGTSGRSGAALLRVAMSRKCGFFRVNLGRTSAGSQEWKKLLTFALCSLTFIVKEAWG
jgi:hypothetical protein